MNFVGTAKRLDDIDLPMIGKLIGVGEDEIHAVLDTETRNTGFDSKNRPVMLFEPHIFYKQLAANRPSSLQTAVHLGLAYKTWGSARYPSESYSRIQNAMIIDKELALRSASWGLGQIMGFNYGMIGFKSAMEMVEKFKQDEEEQLRAMIKFIIAAGLDDELRNHDWAGFARGYNGPGFAKNGYDKKLANAYFKWQKIKDTPVP
jgi:hypothetical protein